LLLSISCLLFSSLAIVNNLVSRYSGSVTMGLVSDVKKWLQRLEAIGPVSDYISSMDSP